MLQSGLLRTDANTGCKEDNMRRTVKAMLMIMLAASLMLIMGSCGKSEPTEVSGTLTNAVDKQITVRTEEGPVVFKTADDTVYNLGDAGVLTVGDTIKVKYHKSMGKDHVDEVTVLEHFKPELIFEGTVSGLKDGSLTVTGKSLTVSFTRDNDTTVKGELKVGAEVEIIYDGDISEFPYASEVTVTKKAADAEAAENKKEEKKEEKAKTTVVSGIVSEFTEKSMLLSIDSANSYRFTLAKGFKVTGADKYVHAGDSVNVTFTGELNKNPEAVEINIVKKAQAEGKTVNGTISSVEKDYLTLNTGKKSYIIHTDKNTKYTGDKPAKGYKTEITYTGNLGKDAKAVNVYCVKTAPEKTVIFKVTFTDGAGNILSTQTVEKGKAATAPANPSREGYTFKGWDKKFDKVTSDLTVSAVWEKNKEPEPEPEKEFTVEGVITLWPSGDDDAFNVMLDDGSELTLTAGDYTEIASGYFPEEEDKVKVVYTDPSMKATKIELLERVVPEEQGKDDQGGEAAPEEKSEEPAPEEQPAEPEPAPAEEAAEPEPEPAAEPELAAEPEPEPKEEPDIVVSAKGTIIEGNEKKRTVKIKTEDGEEVTLNIDDKCDISSGFFPQKDDVVEIKYMKKAMVLKAVKLIDRPEQAAPDAQSE